MAIEVRVLGALQVLVDGEDLAGHLSMAQRSVLGLLAAVQSPMAKTDVCRIVGLSPKSIDPLLSKLRGPLGTSRPVHRGRTPGPGSVALDPEVVSTDVEQFRARAREGIEAHARGLEGQALSLLLQADRLWRGELFDGIDLIEAPDAGTNVRDIAEELLTLRRQVRQRAAWCWLGGARTGLGADRLRAWAEELRDDEACWSAATQAALHRSGAQAAIAVLARWREQASIEDDAALGGTYGQVARLLEGHHGGRMAVPPDTHEQMARAEAAHLAGDWDEAEAIYLQAADDARARGDILADAEVTMVMARLSWDPSRFGGALERRMSRLLDELPSGERLVRARLYACLAGGLYQDGAVDVGPAVEHARRALELVGELDDPLTEAEVLSHARKALIDIDPPEVQIERSRRILSFARGTYYHRSLGLLAVIVDLLFLAREDEARAETEAYRELAERTRAPLHVYHSLALDGMWALVDRRYDEIGEITARAEALAGDFGGMAVVQVVYGQRLWAAFETGDHDTLRDMLPLVDAVVGVATPVPVWELTGAFIASTVGDDDEALDRFRRVARATGDFTVLSRGPLRIAALAVGTLVADSLHRLGHDVRSAARGLHAQLVDNSAHGVVIGWPALYLGHKQRFTDLAAEVAEG